MPEPSETLEKLNSLKKNDYIMIVNLINQLSIKNEDHDDLTLFKEIREETSKTPLTDEEISDS